MKKLISGSDGELSIRKILGILLIIIGIILLFIAEKPTDSIYSLIFSLRGVASIFSALFMFGFITIQNIKSIISSKKGE